MTLKDNPMLHWLHQVGRALTRLLNAMLGGEGDTTFSARTWHEALSGSRFWALVARAIDAIAGAGHCREAHEWHAEHRLFEKE